MKKQGTEESAGTPAKSNRFVWEAVMTKVLQSAPDNEMDMKTLYMAVVAKWGSWLTEDEKEKKLENSWFRFVKKLKKADLFEVRNRRVKLVAAKKLSSGRARPQTAEHEAGKEKDTKLQMLGEESELSVIH